MNITTTVTAYVNRHPIQVGAFTLLATLAFGMTAAFALGLTTPAKVFAQVVTPCCVVVPPPPPIIPPPVIIPPIIPPVVPTCTLTATPNSFGVNGGTTVLAWTTQNALGGSIDNGVGDVGSKLASGSASAPVTQNATFTMTVTGTGGVSTCKAPVKVEPPLVASCVSAPTSATTGANVTWTASASGGSGSYAYDWTGTDGLSGSSKSVSKVYTTAGTKDATVSVSSGTQTKTATCAATITTPPPPPPSAPTCTLTANPNAVVSGDTSSLSWTTTNATGFSINQGIGSVTPVSGGATTTPALTSDTTYTGTVTGPGGTATCAAKVTMVTSPPPSAPTCTLTAFPSTITSGQSSVLAWTTTNADQVAIDQGLGLVAKNDRTSVSPTANTAYTLTATGPGGTKTCTASVVVNPVTPNAPVCTLSAVPNPVDLGAATLLSWTTQNVTSLSIDQGVGDQSAHLPDGSVHSNAINVDTKFTATATGPGGTTTCSVDVPVKTVTPAPTCTLSANPNAVASGDTSSLSWTTTNATGFSINQGIGSVTPVSGGATTTPKITSPTTYTGTVTGPGGTATCDTKVTITSPSAPSCTLTADPSSVYTGDHAVLSWTTVNADTFSIDQGIGAVSPAIAGTTTSKAINVATIFTGTVRSPSGQVATCTANVSINGGGSGGPSCTMTATPSTIPNGGTFTLTWGGSDIKNVDIDHGIATATTSPGSLANVSTPGSGTYTYNGTFHATNGETLTCSATVTMTGGSGGCTSNCGGGGGSVTPHVVLFSHPVTVPLAYLYLSQIPYTGLDLGTWGTAIYWTALIAWSAALAYLVLFGVIPFANRRVRLFGLRVAAVLNAPRTDANETPAAHLFDAAPEPAPQAVPMPTHAPRRTEPVQAATGHQHYSPYEGFRSFATGHNGALSIDDIVKGLSRAHSVRPAPEPEQATAPAFESVAPVRPQQIPETVQATLPAREVAREAAASVPATREAPTEWPDVPAFIGMIIANDRDRAFAMLRNLTRSGEDAGVFLAHVACALDDAYRARIEQTPAHPDILELTRGIATPVLERVVSAFATAIDSSYSHGITGAKLALTRAFATLGG